MNNDEFIKYYSWLKNFNKNNNNSQYGSAKPTTSEPNFSSLTKDNFKDSGSLIKALTNITYFTIKNDTETILNKIQVNFSNKIRGLIYLLYFVNEIKVRKEIKNIEDIKNIKIEKLFDNTTKIINPKYTNLLNIFNFILSNFNKLNDTKINEIFDKLGKIQYNSKDNNINILTIYTFNNDLITKIKDEKNLSDAVYKLLTDEYTNSTTNPSSTGATSKPPPIPLVSFDDFFNLFNSNKDYTDDIEYTDFINKVDTNNKKKYYNPALYFPFFTELKDISQITTSLFKLDLLQKLLTQISNVDFTNIDFKNIVKNINNAKSITPTDLDSITDDNFLNAQLIKISPISSTPATIHTSKSSSLAPKGPVSTKPLIIMDNPNTINNDIINKITHTDTQNIINRFINNNTNIIDNKYLSLLVNNEIIFTNTNITTIIPNDLKSYLRTSPRTTNFISQRGGVESESDSYKFDYILNDTLEYTLTITDTFIIDKYWNFYKGIDTPNRVPYQISNIENLQDFKNNWINNIREYHEYIEKTIHYHYAKDSLDFNFKNLIVEFDKKVLEELGKITGESIGYNKLKEVLKKVFIDEIYINYSNKLGVFNSKNINDYIIQIIFKNIDGYNPDGDSNPSIFRELSNESNFYNFNEIIDKQEVFNSRTNTILLDNQLVISDNFETLLFLKNNSDGYLYGIVSLTRAKEFIKLSYDFTKLYLFYNTNTDYLSSVAEDDDVSITNICLEVDIKKGKSKFINAYVFGYNRDADSKYITKSNEDTPLYGYKIDLINESDSYLKQFENYENTRYLLFQNEIYELDKYLYETYKSMLLIDTFIFNDTYKYNDGMGIVDKDTEPTLKSSYIDIVDIIKQDAMKTFTKTDYNNKPIKSYFGYFWNFKDIFNYNKRELDYSLYYISDDNDDNKYINTNIHSIKDYIYKNKNNSIFRLFANAEEEFIDNKIFEYKLLFDINYRIYNNKFATNKFQIEFKQYDDKFLYEFPRVSNYQIMNKLECFETALNKYNIRIYSEIFYKNAGDIKEDSDFKIQNTYLDISPTDDSKNEQNFAPESQIVKIEGKDDIFIAGDLCIKITIWDINTPDELGTIYYNNRYTNTKEKILEYITESNIILYKPKENNPEGYYYICQKSEFINEGNSFPKRRFYISEDQSYGFVIMKEINYLNQKEYYYIVKDGNSINIKNNNANYKNLDYTLYSLDNKLTLNKKDAVPEIEYNQIFYIENEKKINKIYAFYFENKILDDEIKNKIVLIYYLNENEFIKTKIHAEIERNENTAKIKLYKNDNPADKYATLTVKYNDKKVIDKKVIEYITIFEVEEKPTKDKEDKSFDVIKPKPFYLPTDDYNKIDLAKPANEQFTNLDINSDEVFEENIDTTDYSTKMKQLKDFLYNVQNRFKEMEENLIKKDEERDLLERSKNEELLKKEAEFMNKKAEIEEYFKKQLENESIDYDELSKRVEALLVWLDENKINKLLD